MLARRRMWPSRGVCSLSVRCVLTWTFLITPAHLGLSGALDCSRGVCSLSVRCAPTWTFLITPAHLGLSGALDCNRGVCSLSVRCALTWTCLITPAHLGLSGALGRSRGACSLTGGVCRRWDAPHPKSLRGVVCGPQKPKRLNADENCPKIFFVAGAFVGATRAPESQKT